MMISQDRKQHMKRETVLYRLTFHVLFYVLRSIINETKYFDISEGKFMKNSVHYYHIITLKVFEIQNSVDPRS